jgi:putative phage-type endonuclease
MSANPLFPLLEKCNYLPIEKMVYETWLELRKGSIGGSDAGGIMCLAGDYGSPLTVYLQKKGLEKSKDMSPAIMRGKILEPVIFKRFTEAFPTLNVVNVPYILYSKSHSFMSANIDGFIVGTAEINGIKVSGMGILEIKTSKSGFGYGDDEVPDSHYAQVQHYLSVTDLQWAVIAVYVLEQEDIKYFTIPRNDEFIKRLIVEEKNFMENFLIPSVMPAAIGIPEEDDMITGMYDGSASTLNLTEEEKKLCMQIHELKEQIKPLEKLEKAAKTNLKAKLIARAQPSKEERKLSAIGGCFSVSWSFIEQRRVDSEALKKAGLYDTYSKLSEYDRLTVTYKKGA